MLSVTVNGGPLINTGVSLETQLLTVGPNLRIKILLAKRLSV
jgi:hypothetical protein